MSLSYDVFTGAFLSKVNEYDFAQMLDIERTEIVDGYMKRALAAFKKNCKYNLSASSDDCAREFDIDVAEEDIDELSDIVSEGMVCQWLRPFVYQQENLESYLNTRDFTRYSPAELLLRIREAFSNANKNFIQMIREYSYNHGNLKGLHL